MTELCGEKKFYKIVEMFVAFLKVSTDTAFKCILFRTGCPEMRTRTGMGFSIRVPRTTAMLRKPGFPNLVGFGVRFNLGSHERGQVQWSMVLSA